MNVELTNVPTLEFTRCPFCHENVEQGTTCNACCAISHESCWEEHNSCAACGSDNMLMPTDPPPPPPRPSIAMQPSPPPTITEKQRLTLDVATKLWSGYLKGSGSLDKSDKPHHWAMMARQLVEVIFDCN